MTKDTLAPTRSSRLRKWLATHIIEKRPDGFHVELWLESVRSFKAFLKGMAMFLAIGSVVGALALGLTLVLPSWGPLVLVVTCPLLVIVITLRLSAARWRLDITPDAIVLGHTPIPRAEFGGFQILRRYTETRGGGEGESGKRVELGVIGFLQAGQPRSLGVLPLAAAQRLVNDLNGLL